MERQQQTFSAEESLRNHHTTPHLTQMLVNQTHPYGQITRISQRKSANAGRQMMLSFKLEERTGGWQTWKSGL